MGKPRKQLPPGQIEKIIDDYQNGAGLLTLRERYGHSVGVIRRILTEDGITVRHVGRPQKS
jgi:hypothetical protein